MFVKRNGAHEEISADMVVVSCGAINSAALLLRSANDQHPNGARQRLRRGGTALYGPYEFRADGDFQVPESDRFPKDAFG